MPCGPSWWQRLRGRRKLTVEEALASRPVRNPAVKEVTDEHENFTLVYRPQLPRWRQWVLWVIRSSGEFRFALDDNGARFWRCCDGQRTVREIVGDVQKWLKVGEKEAQASVLAFLRGLGLRGLVGFKIDPPRRRSRRKKKKTARGNAK